MSRLLTLELSDEVYAALQQQASAAGISVTELLVTSLNRQQGFITSSNADAEAQKEARQRLLRYAGAASLGYATGVDNESIDADLARAYANDF